MEGSSHAPIQGRALSMTYYREPVIRDLDIDSDAGTIVGLIGPSGSGKTTTVRMLTGLLKPTKGSATIDGVVATRLDARHRQDIGYLPQFPALFPDLSLWENLSFHASMYGLPLRRRRHLRNLLEWLELGRHRRKRVSEASGGMQRRLALAAALVHDPKYLFLDEPTVGIDPILREKIWRELRIIRDAGRTLLVTTQYVGEAAYCDLVGLLSDGRMLMFDTPESMRRAAFDGDVVDVVLDRPPTRHELRRVERLDVVTGAVELRGPTDLRLLVVDADRTLPHIRERFEAIGLVVTEANEHVVDYDEAFVRVVERFRNGSAGASERDRAGT
jgi:ABC-2 type transport system ATP-binding protein